VLFPAPGIPIRTTLLACVFSKSNSLARLN
jgi:hypothetical protein